jgi:DNA polymerase V
MKNCFIAIDLKSFYASVECVERGLDPLTTNLVVADQSRTHKTICLAVTPSLKAFGIPGRARLFEVISKVDKINNAKRALLPNKEFTSKSYSSNQCLKNDVEVDFICAIPRMQLYMDYSTKIYEIYLKYIAPEDIHVYSVDEVFIDATHYLNTYKMSPKELALHMIKDILNETGITATAGIGTNLYLCKVAMDIVAKHMPANEDGVRIAELDEYSYRKYLWNHRPLTDFWRVGQGYAKKLEAHGLMTMGDVARCSIGNKNEYYNEDLLYEFFGINAELLIDHAWGWEPVSIADIKSYKPTTNSLSQGQVLHCPYEFDKARIIVAEMTDALVLDLVDKKLMTDQIVLTIGYDIDNVKDPTRLQNYKGSIKMDRYGRYIPEHAHGTANLSEYSSSSKYILSCVDKLYEKIVNPTLLIRRITICANHVIAEDKVSSNSPLLGQMDLFTDYDELEKQNKAKNEALAKEKSIQHAMLDIKKKFGKNAIVKGTSLQEGATAMDRNRQIGGHKA